MNATLIGKSFIFVNLILSVLFAAWAVGIFTNRIDWPGGGAPTVPGEKAGEVNKRKDEITRREKEASLALANWQAWAATLNSRETDQRPNALAWYAAKLKGLEDGQGPVTALVYDMAGKLQLRADGAAINGPDGQPLKPRVALQQAIAKAEADSKTENDAANKALKEAEELTTQINGVREGNEVKQKGLRDLLAEEEQARGRALDEIEYLRPFRYNREAEVELLRKRQAFLDARLEELKKVSTAAR